MAGPFNPTLAVGAGASGATTDFPDSLSQLSRAFTAEWQAAVTYPLGTLVGYALVVSAWDVGTTYAVGDLASLTAADGSILLFMSNVPSNVGNVPYQGSPSWAHAAINADIAASWVQSSADIFDLVWTSLVNNNFNNAPAVDSAFWGLQRFPSSNGIAVPLEIAGPTDFPPPEYVGGSETQTYIGPETVTAANQSGKSGAIVQGGFQLVAGSTGTQTRVDASSLGSLTISAAATFAHTDTFQMQLTLKDARGNVLIPGLGNAGIPAATWASDTGGTMTVNAVTGLLTGVGTGTSVITCTVGNLTATVTMTCS